MKGTKRLGLLNSNSDSDESLVWSKKLMSGSPFDSHKAVTSQQLSMVTSPSPLDAQRAESSRRHVRALNTQFASWVQSQLQNHPDELWEDGVQDYLLHASNIMEKFSDVVNWIRENSAKGVSFSAVGCDTTGKKFAPETTNSERALFQEKNSSAPVGPPTTTFFPHKISSALAAPTTTLFQDKTNPAPVGQNTTLFQNKTSTALDGPTSTLFQEKISSAPVGINTTLFQNKTSSAPVDPTSTLFQFKTSSAPSGVPSTNFFQEKTSSAAAHPSTTLFKEKTSFASVGPTTSFAPSWNSGVFSSNQTSFVAGSQPESIPRDASGDADDENDVEQPSSPSVKKTEEKGVIVVHEVKCKLYVKSTDSVDKDAWKDRGTGQLTIKCKEGVSKGTKESKPTIVIRNDVGKVLLNALLYPGIKTNSQKNSIVAIFHTLGDGGGNDGGGGGSEIVARTFLIRTKTEDDRNELAAAIQDYAPAA